MNSSNVYSLRCEPVPLPVSCFKARKDTLQASTKTGIQAHIAVIRIRDKSVSTIEMSSAAVLHRAYLFANRRAVIPRLFYRPGIHPGAEVKLDRGLLQAMRWS